MTIVEKTVKVKVKYNDEPAKGECDPDVTKECLGEVIADMLPESVYVPNDDENTNEDEPEIEISLDWQGVEID